MQLLKDGGKLAIVLPETYLHAPSKKHVLDFLVKKNNIITVIDLPHNTFRPYCNAKTCLLVLEKAKDKIVILSWLLQKKWGMIILED